MDKECIKLKKDEGIKMTGKNMRFSVYLTDEDYGTEEYHGVTSTKVLALIREIDDYNYNYRSLAVFAEMNDGEWLHIFAIDKEDLSDEDETGEEMFIKEWVDCDLDDRSSWIPSFNTKIDEHGGFKFYPN